MPERRLERELGLGHAIMLGSAGTIAASVFVLTGHLAERMGPSSVIVLIILGLLNFSIAFNYAELGTTYPVTGGALTYVREAFGKGLLSYLVGSLDCLSGAFYAALSAIGFAYSLQTIIPWIPIIPTAVIVIAIFTTMNLLGANIVGRAQLLLGGVLLTLLLSFILIGFISPTGFSWDTFVPEEGSLFIHERVFGNLAAVFGSFALIFNAFVGFEIIADDAEEFKDPNKSIPIALFVSVSVVTLVYVGVNLVTLGTVPWTEVAGSEQALTEAAAVFLPRWGTLMVGVAGIVATLTSTNTALLAATHEALTLGRDGLWPKFLSRLGKLRTPFAAAMTVGAIAAGMAIIGLVEFLSYITSTGYLFVVFWASIAMMRLRKVDPDIERPFKVPLFPVTAYIAAGISVLATIFASPTALAFLGGLIVLLIALHYFIQPIVESAKEKINEQGKENDRILVAVSNPGTAEKLTSLAANLSEHRSGMSMEILSIVKRKNRLPDVVTRITDRKSNEQQILLQRVSHTLRDRDVPFYTELLIAETIADGIMAEIDEKKDVRLLLMGWPGDLDAEEAVAHPISRLLAEADADMAVFMDRDLVDTPARILVPFGGGIHSRLALKLAVQMVAPQDGEVVALRGFVVEDPEEENLQGTTISESDVDVDLAYDEKSEENELLMDELMQVQEVIQAELGSLPDSVHIKVVGANSVKQATLMALESSDYDLIVIGAALAHELEPDLFGDLTNDIAREVNTPVLMVRRNEPEALVWIRRQMKEIVEPIEEEKRKPDDGE